MNYFSFKISQPTARNTVDAVLRNERNIEIKQLNQLEDSLIKDSIVFIMLGGDQVSWKKGLVGVAKISKEPFDKGYDPENKKNFKVALNMIFSMKEPIKRESLIYYVNSYDAGGIGPATRGEQNQAIKALTGEQAVTILRAMIDADNDALQYVEDAFDEEFLSKITGEIPMLLEYRRTFGERLEVALARRLNENKSILDESNLMGLRNKAFIFECLKMLFESKRLSDEIIAGLSDSDYCTKNIGFGSYSILLKVDNRLPFDEQCRLNGGNRYYPEVFQYKENNYYVCNNWYPDNRESFFYWLKKLFADEPAVRMRDKGSNVLLYGVPGSGKSHKIAQIVSNEETTERIVFHPDYTYYDFVGQLMPRLKKSKITGEEKLAYEFVEGPFTNILNKAVHDKARMYYLVIEEINRGNAPAIFGDIFQLLDRNEDGTGKYQITNYDIAIAVYKDEYQTIRMPNNLTLIATMNTSDQNVFTLDTAFQRRWDMTYIENDVLKANHAHEEITGSDITWGAFASVINEEIIEYNSEVSSSEDKQLGAYFVRPDELKSENFPEKALKYLWDDAFKLDREKIFGPDIKSIGALIGEYKKESENHRDPIKRVMKADVYKKMMDMCIVNDSTDIDGESDVFDTEALTEEQ